MATTASTSLVAQIVPTLGESVSEATIAAWVKQDWQAVVSGDVIAELETDKATVELPATASGVLKILKPQGSKIAVGDAIASVDPAGKATVAADAPVAVAVVPAAPHLSPAVQKVVTENKLNPQAVAASGPKGNITKGDALEAAAKAVAVATQAAPVTAVANVTPVVPAPPARPIAPQVPLVTVADEVTRTEMSKLRQTIAKRLVEAQHGSASLTTFNEVDMTAILALRERYKERFEKSHAIGLGFMSFFAKAICHAIKSVPQLNGHIEGTEVVTHRNTHLGVAVSTERGLVVPVVRNANLLNMAQIELEIKRLAARGREGKLSPDDMSGGTFTITNGGVFGSLLSTPILNPPQAGILGLHKIEKRAVVIEDKAGDRIEIRPMMYVALTYDHRLIDGQQSVTFLVKIKEAIEDPARILLEI